MARKTKPVATEFNMTATVDMSTSAANTDALLGDLLDQLGDDDILETLEAAGDDDLGDDSLLDEVIEAVGVAGEVGADIVASAGDATDALLNEITDAADKTVAKQALYAEQDGQPQIGDATPPESDPTTVEDAATGKGKKGGKKKKATAEGDEPTAPKEPKTPRATSVTHKPGDLLLAKLGAKAPDFLTLRLSDAELDEEAMQERRADFIARMNDSEAIADKVREKMNMLFVWMSKGGALNEVMRRTFTLMHKDGFLTSGDKGNLQLDLLAKPYSIGTARSQANQMFCALPELSICLKEKGRMVPNPDSALLPMIYSMLGLA